MKHQQKQKAPYSKEEQWNLHMAKCYVHYHEAQAAGSLESGHSCSIDDQSTSQNGVHTTYSTRCLQEHSVGRLLSDLHHPISDIPPLSTHIRHIKQIKHIPQRMLQIKFKEKMINLLML